MALQIALHDQFGWFHQLNSSENKKLLEKPEIRDHIIFIRPRIIELRKFPITIGRSDGNNIIINNSSVSRRHAEIVCRGIVFKSYFIRDLDSKNKTAITRKSGKIVSVADKFVRINSGDRINLGFAILRVL